MTETVVERIVFIATHLDVTVFDTKNVFKILARLVTRDFDGLILQVFAIEQLLPLLRIVSVVGKYASDSNNKQALEED